VEAQIDNGRGEDLPMIGFTVLIAWTLLSVRRAVATVRSVLLISVGSVKNVLLEIVPSVANRVIAPRLGEMKELCGCTLLSICVRNSQEAMASVSPKSKKIRASLYARGFAMPNLARVAR
jgi:hypothetical protein